MATMAPSDTLRNGADSGESNSSNDPLTKAMSTERGARGGPLGAQTESAVLADGIKERCAACWAMSQPNVIEGARVRPA